MLSFPNCKINLGLFITQRRADGYHDLETVFYPVTGLKDALEIVPSATGETTIELSGKAVDGSPENNLVWKAWKLMEQQFPQQVYPAAIYLHKAIPMGAGMGGGSADGAFALRLFNDFYQLGLNDDVLAGMALQLGSDCPFFIYNTPQFASGRGELLQPAAIDLSAYSLQLICPGVHVSTAKAFQMIRPQPASFDLRQLAQLPPERWKDNVINDFEIPVFGQHPELAAIKAALYDAGALYAAMSGTGSTVFGIFEKGRQAGFNSAASYYFE